MDFWLVAFFVFALPMLAIVYLRPLAVKLNFVDSPNERKSHNGHVPLIGGICTLLGVWLISMMSTNIDVIPLQFEYTLIASILVLVGLIDDKLDISAVSRLCVIATISVWLVEVEGISLNYLGNIFNTGDVYLNSLSLLFTSVAVIGCITAFNMVDGIDGLLGVLASVSIGSLGLLFWMSGHTQVSQFCFLFITAMLPYVCFNLGLRMKSKYKVFMGDSGSFLVGFTVIWLLVFATQETNSLPSSSMQPVTALWIIAVPLMDMALVMIRRLIKGQSPFKADRTHIHHILIAYGVSARMTLCAISFNSIVIAAVGIALELYGVNEATSLISFLILFAGYSMIVSLIRAKTTSDIEVIVAKPAVQSDF